MGCDIHAVFQKRTPRGWQDVSSAYEQNRHYFLFAWLADVRNGFGFAGIPTHDPIAPIAKPRGLPSDFDEAAHNNEEQWMGDHSHSWLTADEILSTSPPLKGISRTGIIPMELYRKWDGKSSPEEWSGGITGPNIVVAESPAEITAKTTHVRVDWEMPGDELDYFLTEVRRLKNAHGNVRMVFGFDS